MGRHARQGHSHHYRRRATRLSVIARLSARRRPIIALIASLALVYSGMALTTAAESPDTAAAHPATPANAMPGPAGSSLRSTSAPLRAAASQAPSAFATGDVFAGLSNGSVNQFGSDGTSKATLATGASSYETGMCFDGGGNLYVTNFGNSNVSKFNNLGGGLQFPWVGSDTFGEEHPESCVVDNQQHIFVGSVDPGGLREFDSSGTLLKTFVASAEDRGIDWIDLSGDQCTMLYTSEGPSIKAYDVCNNTQLNDFADGLPAPCYELRILRDGRVAVACSSEVVLLSSTGSVVGTYSAASLGDGGGLFAFNLTPDNSAFWTADLGTGDIWKVRFSDGAVLTHVAGGDGVSGLAVFGEGGPVGEPLRPSESYGGGGLSSNNTHCNTLRPVDCATGNFWHATSDLAIAGRGPALDLTRTYNAQNAVSDSPFGHGWSSTYTDHLNIDSGSGDVTVVQENGSTATFHSSGGGGFTAPPRIFASLVQHADGSYTFTRRKRENFHLLHEWPIDRGS